MRVHDIENIEIFESDRDRSQFFGVVVLFPKASITRLVLEQIEVIKPGGH